MTSAKPCFGSTSKTPETHFSMIVNVRQEANPVNVPSGIDAKQINRLGLWKERGGFPMILIQWVPRKSKTYF